MATATPDPTGIILALAGVSQAINCVQEIAWNGKTELDNMETLLQSLLITSPSSTISIFGSSHKLNPGIRLLITQLERGGQKNHPEFSRYFANIISLEKQFSLNESLVDIMSKRINQIIFLTEKESILSSRVISTFAETYIDTIGRLPLRIQIKGKPEYLKIQTHQHKVRALLLSAIRCAVLWRQVGGKRRHFFFARSYILDSAKSLLRNPVF